MFTHSCLPNTYITFMNNICFVKSSTDIKEGEEITISYLCVSAKYIGKIEFTYPEIFNDLNSLH